MKKTIFLLLLLSVFFQSKAQSAQQKAEQLVKQYLDVRTKGTQHLQNLKFSNLAVLRGSYDDSKTYQMLLNKVDSLKTEGRKIDARIAKMRTPAELRQGKKESEKLSHEMEATSNKLMDYMADYKGPQVGWYIKVLNTKSNKKKYYLNKELSKVDSAE